jgi:anti-sigma regulatory factor (Ser/Thr protein kinase)
LRLFAGLDAPGQARSFVRDFCSASGFPEDFCDTSVLLVNELVSNAVVHVGMGPTVEIRRIDSGLRFAVCDESPILPTQREPSVYADSGRGLLLLRRLASDWGIRPQSGGKCIWFDLRVVG